MRLPPPTLGTCHACRRVGRIYRYPASLGRVFWFCAYHYASVLARKEATRATPP